MAKNHSIAPFPLDIDRDDFGQWLAGFTDGEGCFALYVKNVKARSRYQKSKIYKYRRPMANFLITLRYDDADVLKMIQSYWQYGCVHFSRKSYRNSDNYVCHKTVGYYLASIRKLKSIVIPHFTKYQLRAKKKNDFEIWKQGVLFIDKIQKRTQVYYHKGSLPKWNDQDIKEFESISVLLRQQRNPEHGKNELEIPAQFDPPSLFDGLT